ncbi:MAG: glucosamine-6-phosphate deaminase [Candidatus Omnitrophica bacterium]|nr:glucosamine-6-phosphate deaminase [Candidatus Omnitrophota bacterium]
MFSKNIVLKTILTFIFFSSNFLFSLNHNLAFRRQKTYAYSELYIGKNRVIVSADYEEMSQTACQMLMARVHQLAKEKEEVILGLPTGNTPKRLYELLRMRYKDDPVWKKVILIQLDEYVEVDPNSLLSFRHELEEQLLRHIPFKRFVGIVGGASDIEEERVRYAREIEALGEIDILVLGIGQNGHLAFNEPGFITENSVGVVELTPQTKEVNHVDFTHAYTLSLKTILSAKEIILLASGEKKKEILEKAIFGIVTPAVPASFLQNHPQTTFILDHSAASDKILK